MQQQKFLLSIILALALYHVSIVNGYMLQVITLTRHGDRSPDLAITKSCPGIFKTKGDVQKKFSAYPGLLTPRGIQRMRDVGAFIGQRYISGDHFDGKWLSNKGFMEANYNTLEWEFMAREGNRQQTSMSAVALGIFPNIPVPITVARRYNDNILGGPPPECGDNTANMIIKWHKTKGVEIVDSKTTRMNVLDEVEKLCNVSLAGNPVNAIAGGPNPHCWIGDISDTADTWYSSAARNDPFSAELRSKLTDLAFDLEQGSHFDDPRAPIWFTGAFPLRIISSFEQFSADPEAPRPKRSPKMRMHLCSRELFYGLIHLFDLDVQAPGQPHGRVLAGSTFIWELHTQDDIFHPNEKGLVVRSYYWQPGMESARPMMREVSLNEFRMIYLNYLNANGGPWYEQCDLTHYNDVTNVHSQDIVNPDYIAIKAQHEKYIEKWTGALTAVIVPPKAGSLEQGAFTNFIAQDPAVDEGFEVQQETALVDQVSNVDVSGQTVNEADQSSTGYGHAVGVSAASLLLCAALYYKKDSISEMMQGGQSYQSIP